MNPTIAPVVPAPVQQLQAPAPQIAPQAPLFAGKPLDSFDPQALADNLEDAIRSNPKASTVLDAVKRVLGGDSKIVDEQIEKVLTPVNSVVEKVRAVAGDSVADQLQAQITKVVTEAKSKTAIVQTLPLLVDPFIEKMKEGIEAQVEKLADPDAREKLEQQMEQLDEQRQSMSEMITTLLESGPELAEKAGQLIDAVAEKLGLGSGSGGPGGLFGGLLGGLLGGNKPTGTEESSEPLPKLDPEAAAALQRLLEELEKGQQGQ